MEYTKNQTIDEFNKEIFNIEKIYKAKFINWKGNTIDTKEYYTEIIANELLANLNTFSKINQVQRTQDYRIPKHFPIMLSETTREEEIFAKRISGLELKLIGKILDYQINIKGVQKDESGKIDLISFNNQNKKFHLIEFKYKGNSNDTLLRTILEIYTYFKQVDRKKLVTEYLFQNSNLNTEPDIEKIKVVPTVLLTDDCLAYEELQDINSSKRNKLKTLILSLNIEIFSIELSLSNYFLI